MNLRNRIKLDNLLFFGCMAIFIAVAIAVLSVVAMPAAYTFGVGIALAGFGGVIAFNALSVGVVAIAALLGGLLGVIINAKLEPLIPVNYMQENKRPSQNGLLDNNPHITTSYGLGGGLDNHPTISATKTAQMQSANNNHLQSSIK